MGSIIGIVGGIIAIIALVIPRIWKTPEDRQATRKEDAKEKWDKYYSKDR